MVRGLDLTGRRFGRLTALRRDCLSGNGQWRWVCVCDCGKSCSVAVNTLTRGNSRSCGCLRNERRLNANYRHGLFVRGRRNPELYAYCSAKQRCQNPKDPSYRNYGGRGIEFRFANFAEFLATVGPRPSPKHSIDRSNNNGHYEPGNMRWATKSEQIKNQRRHQKVSSELSS